MKKGILILGCVAAAVISLGLSRTKSDENIQASKRPNIILILADDMGFSDLGSYGGEIKTPNLDYLAYNGIRYQNFYNTSRCCPTRAALLTGLYNHQAGIGKMTDSEGEPGYQGHITPNAVTLAEVLKTAGYSTAMVGKWHVSNTLVQKDKADQLAWLNHQKDFGDFSPKEQYPTKRGFDKFFGTIWGVIDFFDPFSLVNGSDPVKNVPKDYYHTDALSDTAVAYVNQFAKSEKPFFMYLAHNAPHWPLMALPEDIAKYKNTYNIGWKAIQDKRYARLRELGLIDKKTSPLPEMPGLEEKWKSNSDQKWDEEAMAVHAAMIDRMDQGIGRLIEALRKNGQLENTLIVFLSDNGASSENCANYGPGFDRPSETRDGRKIVYATKKEAIPGPQTSYTSIGPDWASVSNTPYRYWKAQSYEGGVHTPMIAFWPKGISAKKGSFSPQVGHVMDFMKTFCEITGAKYPQSFNGHKITASSGQSLVPSFKGKSAGHDLLFNEHFGARYARSGNWKLVAAADTTWHLYDMAKDRTETNDLAKDYPEKVADMKALWKKWAEKHEVYPKP